MRGRSRATDKHGRTRVFHQESAARGASIQVYPAFDRPLPMQDRLNSANDAAFRRKAQARSRQEPFMPLPIAIPGQVNKSGGMPAQGRRKVQSTIVTDEPPIHVLPAASSSCTRDARRLGPGRALADWVALARRGC